MIYASVRSALPTLLGAPLLLCFQLAAEAAPFEKGVEQFCINNLSASRQSELFSRIVNIGASFGHGCMGCDSAPNVQGFTELSNGQFWVRRNYLTHFLSSAPWKNPAEFRFESIYVLENDSKTKPTALISKKHLKDFGYTGEWLYDPARGAFGHLSSTNKTRIVNGDPELLSEANKVGGPLRQRKKVRVRENGPYGTLMRTVPGRFATEGAQPKSVFDLSIDGGFLEDLFMQYGNPEVVQALLKSQWRDPELREQAVHSFAAHLASLQPSVVFGVDTLFWDTVMEALYRLNERGAESPLVRIVFAVLEQTPIGVRIFDQERRENIRADFLQAMSLVSKGYPGYEPVPVLMARLADMPLRKFKARNYMPVLATVFGQYFEQITGLNLIDDLLYWLDRIVFSGPSAAQSPFPARLQSLSVTFSAADRVKLQEELRWALQRYSTQGSKPRFSSDPLGGRGLVMLPSFTKGIVGPLVAAVLVELPEFLQGLADSFDAVNRSVVAVGEDAQNNLHVMNVDEFFENLGYFLNPRTAHPSVLGAKRMAAMVERTLCGEAPNQKTPTHLEN